MIVNGTHGSSLTLINILPSQVPLQSQDIKIFRLLGKRKNILESGALRTKKKKGISPNHNISRKPEHLAKSRLLQHFLGG